MREVSPPPPLPDFTLSICPSSTTVNQGATSTAIQVSVQSLNGFSGDVQATLSGMPFGVTANPQSPYTTASGGSATLLLGASPTASTGNSAIAGQGSSGALTHSGSTALTVPSGTAAAVSRSTYTRPDAQTALDDPAGVSASPARNHFARRRFYRQLITLTIRAGISVGVSGRPACALIFSSLLRRYF